MTYTQAAAIASGELVRSASLGQQVSVAQAMRLLQESAVDLARGLTKTEIIARR